MSFLTKSLHRHLVPLARRRFELITGTELCSCVNKQLSSLRFLGAAFYLPRGSRTFANTRSAKSFDSSVQFPFFISGLKTIRSTSVYRHTSLPSQIQLKSFSTLSSTHSSSILPQSSSMAESEKNTKRKFERLPGNVVPVNYNLKLKPDLANFTFEGSEDVKVKVNSETNQVRLNCCEIEIQSVTFKGAGQEQTGKVTYREEEEEALLEFPQPLPVGEGTLSLSFTGILNDKMRGFYRSSYKVGEETRYAAVTQFEATDARRSFPCWDEPAIKATFDVTLVVPKDRVALSNMPVVSESAVGDSLREVKYGTSPIMSTYLLAFVVGEFDYVEKTDADGVLVRVYTPTGKKEQGNYALDVAVKTLPFYRNYFGIAYPLPKCDLIAIADFSAGAMENWGLITYRETALLVDPTNTSIKIRMYVALVVGHELAHQWFGNLVTMEWWTHLWLNEGFASWIEYLCVDYCFPEYDVWTQFVNNDLARALDMDALDNSHPIEVEVGHPAEVDEIFDAISYSKGSSVIRMLHNYLEDENFKKGMNKYLIKHQYKNTKTEDLWEALEESSGLPVGDIMRTWTLQMGFPVLKVSREQSGSSCKLTVKQSKFTANGNPPKDKFHWLVPVSVCTQADPTKAINLGLLEKQTQEFDLPNVKEGSWVKLNAGAVGVYRVEYPSEMLESMIPSITNLTMAPKDRLNLQSDLFALCRAGQTRAVDVLKVALAFENERDFTVWNNIAINMASFKIILQYSDAYDAYKKFLCKMYKKVSESVGWDPQGGEAGEDPLTPMLRDLVLGVLGKAGQAEVVAEAQKRFDLHCSGTQTLPADIKTAVYGTVLVNGNEETFEKMLTLYRAADMQEEKVRISRCLGNVQSPELIQRVLDFSISDEVRSQDSVFVVAGATGSVLGREMAWQFFRDNFKEFNRRYEGGFLLSRLVQSTTENFITEEKAQEVEAFFKANPVPAAERTVQQSVENIRLNAKWNERELASVSEYLKSFQ